MSEAGPSPSPDTDESLADGAQPGATTGGDPHQITRLLVDLRNGDEAAMHRLLPLVYEELRRIARRQFGGQVVGHTLSTTALVHEAYLKLAGQQSADWVDRAHFFGVAARAMRQVLINHAKKRATVKRGGDWQRVPLDDAVATVEERADMLLALDEALGRLATLNERASRVVEYRFFGGMAEEEVAAVMGVSARTVRRDWLKARLWLYTQITQDPAG